jgi:CMP-2-keto-3-deoxyoctulosonic acid synthetase
VHPEMIESAVSEILAHEEFNLGTLIGKATKEEFLDVNEVKVVFNDKNQIQVLYDKDIILLQNKANYLQETK